MTQPKVQKRENWGTRIGFLLTCIFSAVGIGNMWRFPFRCAQNGGGAFLVPFVLFIITMSMPSALIESAAGKYGRGSVAVTFQKTAGLRGLGLLLFLLNMVAAYYMVVVSQSFYWVGQAAANAFAHTASETVWAEFMANKGLCFGMFVFTLILSCIPPYFGIQKGIERVAKYIGAFAFVLVIVGAIRAVLMPGAMAGVSYFLTPDWKRMFTGDVLSAALSQAYFTYGAGWGWYLVLSTYLKRTADVGTGFINTGLADTSFSLLAGFAIIPTLFAAGYTADTVGSLGASTAYVAMPMVFQKMPGGYLVSLLFFVALAIAAYSCGYVLVEVVASFFIDAFKVTRQKGVVIAFFCLLVCGAAPSMSEALLGNIDNIFGSFLLPTIVTLEVYAVCYRFGGERLRVMVLNVFGNGYIGKWIIILAKYFVPVVNIFLMLWTAHSTTKSGGPWFLGWPGLIAVVAVALLLVFGTEAYDKRKAAA